MGIFCIKKSGMSSIFAIDDFEFRYFDNNVNSSLFFLSYSFVICQRSF